MRDTELARRVTTMLRAKAEQVTVETTGDAFDPDRPPFLDDIPDLDLTLVLPFPGSPRSPGSRSAPRIARGRRLVLAAAVIAVLAGIAIAAGASRPSDEPTVAADADDPRMAAPGDDDPPAADDPLASASVEVRGDGATPTLCVRPEPGSDPRCEEGLAVSLLIDDIWYVAAAAAGGEPVPVVAAGWGDPPFTGDPGMLPLEDRALPAETSTDAGWTVTLVAPPAGVELVWVEQGTAHVQLDRPTTDAPTRPG
jgi:hypothetical protein